MNKIDFTLAELNDGIAIDHFVCRQKKYMYLVSLSRRLAAHMPQLKVNLRKMVIITSDDYVPLCNICCERQTKAVLALIRCVHCVGLYVHHSLIYAL